MGGCKQCDKECRNWTTERIEECLHLIERWAEYVITSAGEFCLEHDKGALSSDFECLRDAVEQTTPWIEKWDRQHGPPHSEDSP